MVSISIFEMRQAKRDLSVCTNSMGSNSLSVHAVLIEPLLFAYSMYEPLQAQTEG